MCKKEMQKNSFPGFAVLKTHFLITRSLDSWNIDFDFLNKHEPKPLQISPTDTQEN